jgi:hypothetical protein
MRFAHAINHKLLLFLGQTTAARQTNAAPIDILLFPRTCNQSYSPTAFLEAKDDRPCSNEAVQSGHSQNSGFFSHRVPLLPI